MIRILSRGAGIGLAMIGIFSCSEHSVAGADNFNSDDLTADAARIATVGVSFASPTIAVGDTTRATATLRDYQGRLLLNRYVNWSSSDSAVATVSSSGLVTGIAEGTAQITASRAGKSGTGTITVTAAIGGTSTPPPPTTNPGTVTDLKVTAIDSTGVTLAFTQVDDGTGQPAKYDIRYAAPPIAWGSATSATSGSCAVPVAGTAIGTSLVCKVMGLSPSTQYEFQLIAFRGTLNFDAVFGALSVVASATTTASTPLPPPPVASVAVSPATATVQVGSSVQLSAIDRDANGNVLTGRVVTWSSANPAIASVNASGLVTALAAGTAQITATSETKSGSAAVTVQALPPPPPPPSGSNEPPGMTFINQRSFSSLQESPWYTNSNLSIVQDATAPKSPSGVIRATFPAGYAGGTSPGPAELSFNSYKTLYVSYYAKYSSNWQGHLTGINKHAYAWVNGTTSSFVMEAEGIGSGPLSPRPILQSMVVGNGPYEPNLVPNATITRNTWFHIEIVIVGNSAGTADGTMDIYLDGVHVTSAKGLQWSSGAARFNIFQFYPIWGGISDTVTNTMWFEWDDVYISGKN